MKNIVKIGLLCLCATLLMGACQQPSGANNNGQANQAMSSFTSALSPDAMIKWNKLDDQHKQMAVDMANKEGKDPNKAVDAAYDMQTKK